MIATVRSSVLRRIVTIWIWSAGLSYLATASLILWFAFDGQIIRNDPDCQPVTVSVAVYWTCNGVPFWQHYLVSALNIGLTTTVWMPVFVASAIAAPEIAPFATALVLSNLIGVPAALFVLWRSLRLLVGRVVAMLAPSPAH
jgi:hypothetical protein